MIIKKFEIYCIPIYYIHILFFFFFYQTTFPSKKQSKEKKSFERKQAKKQKKTKKKSVINQRTLFIPPQCPCPRIIIIGIRLINRDQGQARPGREGTSRSSRLGLLYVHCARAFTPLNTQRHGARFHGVGVYKQGGQRQGTWCPDRERERDERWSTTPKMGYLPLPTLCTMNPAFDSGTVDLLCPLAQPSVPLFFLSPQFCLEL